MKALYSSCNLNRPRISDMCIRETQQYGARKTFPANKPKYNLII